MGVAEDQRASVAMRWLVPCVALSLFGVYALLYVIDQPLYYSILKYAGIEPFRYPFLDGQYILAGADCWRQGVDVYVANPCDILNRPHGYSPLWLRLPVTGLLPATNLIGTCLVVGFLLSLGNLPRPAGRTQIVLILLATVSTMTTFAVERANVDIVMFLLVLCAGHLLLRNGPERLLGYGLVLLAGWLKFYPLVLLLLAVRERLALCIGVCGVAAAATIGFVIALYPELAAMAPNIPTGPFAGDLFGAKNLPYGIGKVLARMPLATATPWGQWVARWFSPLMLLGLLGITAIRAALLASRFRAHQTMSGLTPPQSLFLIIGAALIAGCFLAGQSVGYRGIHFLFAIPGLLAIAATAPDRGERRLFLTTAIVIVLLMWERALAHAITVSGLGPTPVGLVLDALVMTREVLWWWMIGVLAAVLLVFIAEAPAVEALRGLLGIRPARNMAGSG
jgi:hypothetical protein